MAYYSLGITTAAAATAAAYCEFRTSANVRARVMEIGAFTNAATASSIGIGRPAAIGVTPTSPIDFLPEDPADPTVSGQTQSAIAWTTAPTVPAQFLRRIVLPATAGIGVIWTFPRGLIIPVSNSIVLWNFGGATGSALSAYCVVEE